MFFKQVGRAAQGVVVVLGQQYWYDPSAMYQSQPGTGRRLKVVKISKMFSTILCGSKLHIMIH